MRIQTVVVVILALLCGGAAAVGINSLRPADPAPAPPPQTVTVTQEAPKPETIPVVVAAVDIPPFTVIAPAMVKVRDFPKELVPAGAITEMPNALDRATVMSLVKDEAMLDAKLAPRGAGRGMSAKVPAGMRAFTIHLPIVEAAVSGFVLPGNRVDVLLTLEGMHALMPSGKADPELTSFTATLLQDLEILAVEQRVVAPSESKVDLNQVQSVTLLVTPAQAQKLHMGQIKGKLHLSLRNSTDHGPAGVPPLDVKELLEKQTPPEVVAHPRITTLRGSELGMIVITPPARDKGDR